MLKILLISFVLAVSISCSKSGDSSAVSGTPDVENPENAKKKITISGTVE
jgi:hypothetical protein